MKLAATVDYTRMTMMKDVILSVAGRYSDLEAGSTPEGTRALQALTCLIKEGALTITDWWCWILIFPSCTKR